MKKIYLAFVGLVMACAVSQAQVSVSAGADLVSSYQWRGLSITSASLQPGISLEYKGLTAGAWGSTDFNGFVNEFDWYAGYSAGSFSVTVTDYFGPYLDNSIQYFAEKSHILEGTLAFDFASVVEKFPLTVAWSTNFLNDLDGEGDERYSTYIELGYPVKVGDVGVDFALGFTPWEGAYSNEFNVVNLSIKASKELKFTESFSLPVFVQATVNPNAESAHLVFGLSF